MKVYIEQSSVSYANMFAKLGFEVVPEVEGCDLICFTGGADVNPRLYGEDTHPKTGFNENRDKTCISIYRYGRKKVIPMIGICRGAQFLHVMNGGKLHQHVDNHTVWDTHEAVDKQTGQRVNVTSTHHQMMRYAGVGELVCEAKESVFKEHMQNGEVVSHLAVNDVEVMWYEDTKCLCFQPHPEFQGADSTFSYFKTLTERYLGELYV